MNCLNRITLRFLLVALLSLSVPLKGRCRQTANESDTQVGFVIPKFELAGKLARIFTVNKCQYISGMTCSIRYKAVFPLPSQVFFTEFDESGRKVGARVRLIYPKLNPGETGKATFRLRSDKPAKVILEGEWNGPWRNPY
jgi:hypothetical protein